MIVKTCLQPPGNFGDAALNSYLVEKITGRKPQLRSISQPVNGENFLISGSVLASADEKSIVWGAGFLKATDTFRAAPARICAVRGNLTLRRLRQLGIDCDPAIGDPALLLPRFYTPSAKCEDVVGVVPHYVDAAVARKRYGGRVGYKIIDICGGVERVIDEICSCREVLCSSLHGLIVAAAYGVPRTIVHLSGTPHGDRFKFWDYLSSRGLVDLNKLWNACPFKGRVA